MCNSTVDNSDLEGFARFVGLSGTDTDLFYEAYYGLDNEEFEEELVLEELPGHQCTLWLPYRRVEG